MAGSIALPQMSPPVLSRPPFTVDDARDGRRYPLPLLAASGEEQPTGLPGEERKGSLGPTTTSWQPVTW